MSKETEKDVVGVSFALSLIIISIYLIIDDTTFNSQIYASFLATVTGLLGTFGISVELNKLTNDKFKLENISLGIVFISLYIIFSNWSNSDILQACLLIVLLLGIYGTLVSIITIIKNGILSNNSKKEKSRNVSLFIFEIIGATSSIVGVLQALKIL